MGLIGGFMSPGDALGRWVCSLGHIQATLGHIPLLSP